MRVLVVDGNWYLYRAYHVAKANKTGGVRMRRSLPSHILSMVLKDFEESKATHVAVAFDAPDGFRYKIYPKYKANRMRVDVNPNEHEVDPDKRMRKDEVYTFLKRVKAVLRYAGIKVIVVPEMESDDVMAACAKHLSRKAEVYIASRDKDMMQVVNDKVKLYWPGNKKIPTLVVDRKQVKKIKGVWPKQIFDYLCITGDKADNIPGVQRKTQTGMMKNYGGGTVAKILNEHGTLKAALKSNTKEGKVLRKNKDRLHLARKLIALRVDCWKPTIKDVKLRAVDEGGLVNTIGYVPKNIYSVREDTSSSKMKGFFK